MNIQETEFGFSIKVKDFEILFGGLKSQMPQLKETYPDIEFLRLKQIHSDAIVESHSPSEDLQVIGDAHFTTKAGLALCVITADCVPVFIFDDKKKVVAGIHAGWRGVASKIIPKTIQKLIDQGSDINSLNLIVGPHIQKSSFEVEYDVRDQIISSLGPLSAEEKSLLTEKISDKKALVDLNQVVKFQLHQIGISSEKVSDLHLDTMTDRRFHSYRRDKEKSGRQVSFIVLRK